MLGACALVTVHQSWIHPKTAQITVNYGRCRKTAWYDHGAGLYIRYGQETNEYVLVLRSCTRRLHIDVPVKNGMLKEYELRNLGDAPAESGEPADGTITDHRPVDRD